MAGRKEVRRGAHQHGQAGRRVRQGGPLTGGAGTACEAWPSTPSGGALLHHGGRRDADLQGSCGARAPEPSGRLSEPEPRAPGRAKLDAGAQGMRSRSEFGFAGIPSRVLWSTVRDPSWFASRRRAITFACVAATLAMSAPVAQAYTFGPPAVGASGPETTAFDWSADKCDDDDIPDQPWRASATRPGKVVLINSQFTVRRKVGDTLATIAQCLQPQRHELRQQCRSSRYDDKEWVTSAYTTDGGQPSTP